MIARYVSLWWLCVAAPMTGAADILINDLADIEFGAAAPTTGTLMRSMRFCVTLDRRGPYRVHATGDAADGGFVLDNGVEQIPLRILYSDRVNRPGQALQPGTPLTDLRGARRKRRGACRRANTRIDVIVDAAALEAAGPGRYAGTLTLTVTPE